MAMVTETHIRSQVGDARRRGRHVAVPERRARRDAAARGAEREARQARRREEGRRRVEARKARVAAGRALPTVVDAPVHEARELLIQFAAAAHVSRRS